MVTASYGASLCAEVHFEENRDNLQSNSFGVSE
jgi:hypothetical protein